MEKHLYKSIAVELRPKLQSANVFIALEDDCPNVLSVNLNENNFQVILSDNKKFKVDFLSFKAKPSTLSSLKIEKHFVSFRFFIESRFLSDFGSFKTELLENSNVDSKIEDGSRISKIASYVIKCGNCQRSLVTSSLKFNRVLPLPDNLDSSDWFCHVHDSKNQKIPSLEPSPTDLFYSSCFVHVNKGNICNFLSKNGVFVCKLCFNWLGVVHEANTLKLWFNTVTFVSNNKEVLHSTGLSDVFLTINHLFKNCLFNSLKVIFRYKSVEGAINCLLLWILEKQLKMMFFDQKGAKEVTVAKALFNFCDDDKGDIIEQWKNDQNVEVVDISKNMMVDFLKHVHENHKVFPEDFAKSNDFLITYLFMDD